MAIVLASGRNAPVLARRPERLLVEGYRAWLNGYETGSIDCWEIGWQVFVDELGSSQARRLYGEISYWVRETRGCAAQQLRCFPYGCQCLCRDECLLLALVAAVQNGNDESVARAVGHLAAEEKQDALLRAARCLAEALDDIHQRLLPVPPHVIDDVAGRPCLTMFH